ncbi:MAG: hypothetical protein ACYTGG_02095 [Planctomycetota bacterium]|jgi:hypothetical protein
MTWMTRRFGARMINGVIVASALIAMTFTPVLGQDGGRRGGRGTGMRSGGMRGAMTQQFQPDFIRRDAELIRRELDLDDVQLTILESLLLDYGNAFSDAMEAAREEMSELRPQRDEDPIRVEQRRAVMGELREAARVLRAARRQGEGEGDAAADPAELEKIQARFDELREQAESLRPPRPEGEELEALRRHFDALSSAWRREKSRLRDRFLADLQAILTEPQAAHWPDFERTLRREKTLGRGRLSGERVNLFLIVRDLRLDEDVRWEIDQDLVEYAIALDQALVARESFLETARSQMMQAMMAGETDAAREIAAEEAARRTDVRSVNEQFAERLASRLDEETADRFRQRFNVRAYRRIYMGTSTLRGFEIAKSFEDLDADTLGAIEDIEQAYRAELESINARLVQITREREPLRTQELLARRASRQRGERGRDRADRTERDAGPEAPLRDAYRRRHELDQTYRNQLESLLTLEQIAMLPAVRTGRRDRRGQFGADVGDRRRRMMQRFDADGDGQLSEEEREAMRDAFRRDRGGRDGQGRRRDLAPPA